MEFRTVVPLKEGLKKIDYHSTVFSVGSCFAVHMAEQLQYFGFKTACNPYGILFHPIALERIFQAASRAEDLPIFEYADHWHSYHAHSQLSASSAEILLQNLAIAAGSLLEQTQKASHLIITFGTAWVYRHLASNEVVANCHQVPASNFRKELLSVDQIKQAMCNLVQLIKEINPQVQIIFTLSPVRHIKDGFIENQRSKAHLIAAIHDVLAEDIATYFPAYEMMMDDLRDYRFYAPDMLHPSASAIQYIWQRFSSAWIAEYCAPTMKEVTAIRKIEAHKPIFPNSADHQLMLKEVVKKKNALEKQGVNFGSA